MCRGNALTKHQATGRRAAARWKQLQCWRGLLTRVLLRSVQVGRQRWGKPGAPMQSAVMSSDAVEDNIAEAPTQYQPLGKKVVQTRCRVVLRLRPRQDNDADLLETVDSEEVWQ